MLREVIAGEAVGAAGGEKKFARCLAITNAAAARGRRIQHRDFEVMLEAALLDAGVPYPDVGADARKPSHGPQTYLAGQRGRHFLTATHSAVVSTHQPVRERDSLGYMLRVLLGRMMDEGVAPSPKFISHAFWALVRDGDLFAAAVRS